MKLSVNSFRSKLLRKNAIIIKWQNHFPVGRTLLPEGGTLVSGKRDCFLEDLILDYQVPHSRNRVPFGKLGAPFGKPGSPFGKLMGPRSGNSHHQKSVCALVKGISLYNNIISL